MSFILPFFDRIKETYGNDIIYFTGDGGLVLKDLRPQIKLKDLDDLTDYIITKNKKLSLDNVVDLTKIDKHEIVSELKKLLTAYPEKDLFSKYVHFMIYEHCIKWAFEGEDRNRFYFWSATPFYSIKFFEYAMNCPDEIKRNYGLYGGFLLELSPQASAIDYANLKRPIVFSKFGLLSFIVRKYVKLPSKVLEIAKKRITENMFKKDKIVKNNSSIMNCALEQIENCRYISKYLSIEDLKKIIKNSDNLYNIFTITSVIEEFECGKSTIEKYRELDFK